MTEPEPQLNVQALAEALAQAGSAGIAAEALKDSSKIVELASRAPVVRLVDTILSPADIGTTRWCLDPGS